MAVEFQVKNGRIYRKPDGSNTFTEFVVRGVNIRGPGYGGEANIQNTDTPYIADHWRFNLARVNCRIPPSAIASNTNYNRNTGVYSGSTNSNFDNWVTALSNKGVVVMISPHAASWSPRRLQGELDQNDTNETTALSVDELIVFHKRIAERYKNNPYVWFQTCNEPYTGASDASYSSSTETAWLELNREIVKAIRDDVGATNVIVLSAPCFGQDLGLRNITDRSYVLKRGLDCITFNNKTYSDIAFDTHVYEQVYKNACRNIGIAVPSSDNQWKGTEREREEIIPEAISMMTDYYDAIKAKGVCVFYGEYGHFGNGAWDNLISPIVRLCQDTKVGIAFWNWDDNVTSNGGGTSLRYSTSNPDIGVTKPNNLLSYSSPIWDINRYTFTNLDSYQADGSGGGGTPTTGTINFTSPTNTTINQNSSVTFTVEVTGLPSGTNVSSVNFERV